MSQSATTVASREARVEMPLYPRNSGNKTRKAGVMVSSGTGLGVSQCRMRQLTQRRVVLAE